MKKTNIIHLLLVFFLTLFSWSTVMGSISTKPDWSKSNNNHVDLSGNKLTFTLPGNISQDFPMSLLKSVNIYENNTDEEWERHSVAEIWWDYKKQTMLIFPEILGRLKLKIAVYHSKKNDVNLNGEKQLTKGITALYTFAYSDSKGSDFRIPKQFEPTRIKDKIWLKYAVIDKKGRIEGSRYAIAITESHIFEVTFQISKTADYNDSNWYEVVQKDIDKLIDSFQLK